MELVSRLGVAGPSACFIIARTASPDQLAFSSQTCKHPPADPPPLHVMRTTTLGEHASSSKARRSIAESRARRGGPGWLRPRRQPHWMKALCAASRQPRASSCLGPRPPSRNFPAHEGAQRLHSRARPWRGWTAARAATQLESARMERSLFTMLHLEGAGQRGRQPLPLAKPGPRRVLQCSILDAKPYQKSITPST